MGLFSKLLNLSNSWRKKLSVPEHQQTAQKISSRIQKAVKNSDGTYQSLRDKNLQLVFVQLLKSYRSNQNTATEFNYRMKLLWENYNNMSVEKFAELYRDVLHK